MFNFTVLVKQKRHEIKIVISEVHTSAYIEFFVVQIYLVNNYQESKCLQIESISIW